MRSLWIPRSGRRIDLARPLVMGICNLTSDSFSGDGTLDLEQAEAHVIRMLTEGADVIDVGAESARTNRGPIPSTEETERLRDFAERWADLVSRASPRDSLQVWPPLLSWNTWRPEVVAAVLPAGGDLLNDMSALPDDRNARACVEAGAALLLMHNVGEVKVANTEQTYPDLWATLENFFAEKIALAEAVGLGRDSLVLDPGLDFAKQREDNLTILRELDRLQRFGCPVLLPVSRKTFIGEVLGIEGPRQRDAGTLACLVSGLGRGADIFRVHAVSQAAEAVRLHLVLRDTKTG